MQTALNLNTIKQKLYIYMWKNFLQEFSDNNTHTFHYLYPCSCCAGKLKPPLYDKLL